MLSLKHIFIKLMKFFELSRYPIRGLSGERLEGIPIWDLVAFKEILMDYDPDWWRDCFVHIGYSSSIPRINNLRTQWVDIIDKGEADVVYYLCPDRKIRCTLDKSEVAVYTVHISNFLMRIRDFIDLPEFTLDVRRTKIDKALWLLGRLTLKDKPYAEVYVARGLVKHRKAVYSMLEKNNRPTYLLSTARRLPIDIVWPEHVTAVCLYDYLEAKDDNDVSINFRKLFNIDQDNPPPKPPDKLYVSTLPVHYDTARRILTIRGKPEWYVSGESRSLAIRYMYEQAKEGRWELPAKEILVATKIPGQKGGATRIQSLFSSSSDWRNYIFSPRRGFYSFNI